MRLTAILTAWLLGAATPAQDGLPDARAHHQLAFHPGDGRVYLVGGSTPRGEGYHFFDDVWAWDGAAWTRTGGLPFRRSSHALVHHAGRGSLLLVGGGADRDFSSDASFWELRGGTWTRLDVGADEGWVEPGACYDPTRDRLVLFGGWDGANELSGRTLEWAGGDVVEVEAVGPSPRAGHAFVWDPVGERCLVFGGRGEDGPLSDTWSWDGRSWQPHETDEAPPARAFFGATTDPAGRRVVIFGGAGAGVDLGDTWAWDGGRWYLVATDGPAPRGMGRLAPWAGGVLLFGGRVRTADGFEDGNDTWRLVGGAWSRVEPPRPASLRFTAIPGGDIAADVYSSPSASWRDVDGDGDEDLYVLNGYGSLEAEPTPQPDVLYRNDGGGVFTALPDHPLVETPTFSGSGVWGDYDNDGDEDLFVANQAGADNFLYRRDGVGGFVRVLEGDAVRDGGRSFSAAWVDVDGDGWLDLHVLNGRDGNGGEIDFLYRNDGTGGLERVRDVAFVRDTLPSGGAAWADYDADGDQDLFLPVQAAGVPNRLYRNDGGWRFTELAEAAGLGTDPLPGSPTSSAAQWVDYDGDLDLDLFVGTTGTFDLLYRNDGAGRFTRVSAGRVGLDATYVSDILWEDVDDDADLDLVIAVWGGASEIWLNDGEGRLQPADAGEFGAAVHFASSVSSSDIDGDGDRDLFLTQWPINRAGGAPNLLFRNDGPGRGWIDVEPRVAGSSRSAVGARVVVAAMIGGELRRQLRHLPSRTSWRSSDGPALHFGLGDAGSVRSIEVTWPSGAVDTLRGPIPANRRIVVTEGGAGR